MKWLKFTFALGVVNALSSLWFHCRPNSGSEQADLFSFLALVAALITSIVLICLPGNRRQWKIGIGTLAIIWLSNQATNFAVEPIRQTLFQQDLPLMKKYLVLFETGRFNKSTKSGLQELKPAGEFESMAYQVDVNRRPGKEPTVTFWVAGGMTGRFGYAYCPSGAMDRTTRSVYHFARRRAPNWFELSQVP